MANLIQVVVVAFLAVSCLARPQQEKKAGKDRVFEGKVSNEDHFTGDEHNSEYDHEAFLGEEKKTYDQLTPEESKERLA